jgi:riboflavin transporter FmnP
MTWCSSPEEKGAFFMKISTRQIAIASALAALSTVVQLIHIGYQSPTWGMWIDIVSVTWVVAYFIFGLRISILVSLLGAGMISLFAPETWLGASMKLVATLPIIIMISGWTIIRKKRIDWYVKPLHLLVPLLIGIIVRCLVVLPLNYYYAIPIWTGMTPSMAMKAIPWFVIAAFNSIQSIIDVIFAWIIVYVFKINRFSNDST